MEIDYRNLQDLLTTESLPKADQETKHLMHLVSNKNIDVPLTVNDINDFPSGILYTINSLWVESSNDRFGFSVQKRIWNDAGGNHNANWEIYRRYGERVGWYSDGRWRTVDDVPSIPAIGYFPRAWVWIGSGSKVNLEVVSLLSRLDL